MSQEDKTTPPPTINSLEWYSLLLYFKSDGDEYAKYDFISKDPRVVKLANGKTFTLLDEISSANRKRSVKELLEL